MSSDLSKDMAGRRARTKGSERLGGAVIGAHLRRLSERIDRDANRVYAQLGVDFEQRWMGVLDVLARRGPMSVKELARELKISHPSVSQTRSSLIASKLLAERADPGDGRRRTLYLTPKGEKLVARLTPIWIALEKVGQDLNRESGNIVAFLEQLEATLDRLSILDRVNKILNASPASKKPSDA